MISYPKVLALGARGTELVFYDEHIIQEKVDGSQFKFGWFDELEMYSKGCRIHMEQIPNLFEPAVKYISDIIPRDILKGIHFYAEAFKSPKHNVIKYDRVPKNHIMVFDAYDPKKPGWLNRAELEDAAYAMGVEVIPEFHRGTGCVDYHEYLTRTSTLGGSQVEGVVIKNYAQTQIIGGTVQPVFAKFVNAAFKEKSGQVHKSPKQTFAEFILQYRSEARWQKAVLHLREQGLITDSPKDIGGLIKEVIKDLDEEETEEIKEHLYKMVNKELHRVAVQGFAEWYKEQLAARFAPATEVKEEEHVEVQPSEGIVAISAPQS